MNPRASAGLDINDYHVGIVEVLSAQGDIMPDGSGNALSITYTVRYINRDGQAAVTSGVVPMYRANPVAADPGVDVFAAKAGTLWPAIFANRVVYPYIQEQEAHGDCPPQGGGGMMLSVLQAFLTATPNELDLIRTKLAEAKQETAP